VLQGGGDAAEEGEGTLGRAARLGVVRDEGLPRRPVHRAVAAPPRMNVAELIVVPTDQG
jgi:hypothetical protein